MEGDTHQYATPKNERSDKNADRRVRHSAPHVCPRTHVRRSRREIGTRVTVRFRPQYRQRPLQVTSEDDANSSFDRRYGFLEMLRCRTNLVSNIPPSFLKYQLV